jgi:hypothetical protein
MPSASYAGIASITVKQVSSDMPLEGVSKFGASDSCGGECFKKTWGFVFGRLVRFFRVGSWPMKPLPLTGTAALLDRLSPYIPDDLINSLFVARSGPGRRRLFSPAQLFRMTLLALLTPAHSFNLLVALLPEHRPWRSFARLRNRRDLPDAKMLHQFRDRLELTQLRQVNEYLLQPLLEGVSGFAKTVAVIDATDLPAATNAYKKTTWANTVPAGPAPGLAAARMARVAISSATKNTRCDYGFANIVPAFCWPR